LDGFTIIREKEKQTFYIRKMKKSDVKHILQAGFNFGEENIKNSSFYRLKILLGLAPYQTKFVAYNKKTRNAIGYLNLTQHPYSIQSIRYVYTNPNFRRIGVARKLILTAIKYAKKNGTKKIFLNTDPEGFVSDFYKKFGFDRLSTSEIVWGAGKTISHISSSRKIFFPIKINKMDNKNLLFKLYHTCLGEKWISFFNNNLNNFLFGFAHDFKNFFQRSFYLTKQKDSFIAIYNRPFRHTAFSEVFLTNGCDLENIFMNLNNLLIQKSIRFFKVTLFNATNNSCFDILKKYNFYPYSTKYLGKLLGNN
jgi:ribosomal protein S18 acetylase RimI-like enzyme